MDEDSATRMDMIHNQIQGQPTQNNNVLQLHPATAGPNNPPIAVEVTTPVAHLAKVDIRPPDAPDTDQSRTHSNTDQTIAPADTGHDAAGQTPEAPPKASQDQPCANTQQAANTLLGREPA